MWKCFKVIKQRQGKLERGEIKRKCNIVSFERMLKKYLKSHQKLKVMAEGKKNKNGKWEVHWKINNCYEIIFFYVRIFNVKYFKNQEKIINVAALCLKVIK